MIHTSKLVPGFAAAGVKKPVGLTVPTRSCLLRVGFVKDFHRPSHLHRAQLEIVGRVRLAVRATLVADGLELLEAAGIGLAAERRERRLRRHLHIVDPIINRNRAFERGGSEGTLRLPDTALGSDVHFSDNLAWRGGDNAAHRHPRARGDVGGVTCAGKRSPMSRIRLASNLP